ncbi:MAG: DUF3108 domain-containing protein, partial [Methylobacteriaceae bacterium]|nr:DUF3108 domain-containing protein [Methylobacteriaceae bacterium]
MALLPGLNGPIHAAELKIHYDVSFSALVVGEATLTADIQPARYSIKGGMAFIGLAGLITDVKASGAANGRHGGNSVHPANFVVNSRSSWGERTIRMSMAQGNVSSVSIIPPLVTGAGSIPVSSRDKRAVVDPLSALMMPTAKGVDPLDKDNCNRSLQVFDGGTRMT